MSYIAPYSLYSALNLPYAVNINVWILKVLCMQYPVSDIPQWGKIKQCPQHAHYFQVGIPQANCHS